MKVSTISTTTTIQTFKRIVENPILRALLRRISTFCKSDGKNRLEIALELIVGQRSDACHSCKLASKIVKFVVYRGAASFGASEDLVKERFNDAYWRRGLVNVIDGIAHFGVRHPFVPGAPFQVVWNITRACNLFCKHCYENAGRPDEKELNTEEAMRGIKTLAEANVLILAFSGGEPTIRKDIVDLIKCASDHGMYCAVATNGLTFSSIEKTREFKRAGLQFVQVSLDGANPETHDEFRGLKGAFKMAIEAIKNCVSEGLFVEIATTVTRFNFREVPAIFDLAEKLNVNWFMMYNFVPSGRGREIAQVDLTPKERESLLAWSLERMEDSKVQILSTAPQFARVALQCHSAIMPTHFYNPRLSAGLRNLADFIGGCGAGRFYLAVEPNGDIYPCVFFPHEPSVKVGNLLKDDFKKLWRKNKLLLTLRNRDALSEHCGICEYRYVCGGCRARACGYFNDPLSPDPGCIRNKHHWKRIAKNLARPSSL